MALVPSSSGSGYGMGVVDIGDDLPDWTLESQVGSIRCHELIDGKVCLFVTIGYAFDPVTTTEIGAIHKLIEEFEARNITVIILGCDTIVNYRRWCKDIEELQTVSVKYPVVSDESCNVLQRLGCAKPVLPNAKLAPVVNGTFLVDIDKKIRISMKYSPAVGRNIYEVIRYLCACVSEKCTPRYFIHVYDSYSSL